MKGRTDDFRQLGKRLVVVATDLDSGQAARFGEPGLDHVPISLAVQASGALPGLYSPVEIEGRHYVDGVLLKTLHASVALEAGAELLICVNPIVPVDTVRAVEAGPDAQRQAPRPRAADGALADFPHRWSTRAWRSASPPTSGSSRTPTWCCSSPSATTT